MASVTLDPEYEIEVLRFYMARVQLTLDQSKAAGLLAVPASALEIALSATEEQRIVTQLAAEQVEQQWFES